MIRFVPVLCAAVLCAVASCSPTTDTRRVAAVPVSPEFQGTRVPWNNVDSESLILYRAFNEGGFVKVCGVITTIGTARVRALEPQLLRSQFLKAGNTTLVNTMSFFSRAQPDTPIESLSANCVVTGAQWRPEFGTAQLTVGSRQTTFQSL